MIHHNHTSDIKGKVVVITGASAGLGRSIARTFAAEGAKLGLLARGMDGLEGARKEAEAAGCQAVAISTDVSDPSQIETAAQQIEEQLGPIDIWINNAMNSVFAPVTEITAAEFKRVTEVTYLGQVYGTMTALKRMIPRDEGIIILIGSALAYRGIPLQSAYCGAKHGIHGFFESVRSELIHDKSKVRISMLQLPAMNTTQFEFVKSRLPNKPKPMGAIFEPEVAAKATLYLAQHDVRELDVGFSTVKTILGNKIIPGWLDTYLAKTGYAGQQTNEPADPHRKDNLWEPLPGDHGAHGPFRAQSHDFSPQFWAVTHKRTLWTGIAIVALAVTAGWLLKRRSNYR